MKLDIWFDLDCPNCFLSIKQFFRLYDYLGYRPYEDEITFHPLRLNPTVTTNTEGNYLDGVKTHSFLARRKKEKLLKNLLILGKDEGINFDYEKLFPLNTTRALGLILYCQKHEKEKTRTLLLSMYEAYFLQYKNLDDFSVLESLAQSLDLNLNAVKEALINNIYLKAIEHSAKRAEYLGITSVPLFIFNNERALLGYYSNEKVKQLLVEAHF